ncbi:hypothetical protein RB213_005721, partial [Colletotrichum asianum]
SASNAVTRKPAAPNPNVAGNPAEKHCRGTLWPAPDADLPGTLALAEEVFVQLVKRIPRHSDSQCSWLNNEMRRAVAGFSTSPKRRLVFRQGAAQATLARDTGPCV